MAEKDNNYHKHSHPEKKPVTKEQTLYNSTYTNTQRSHIHRDRKYTVVERSGERGEWAGLMRTVSVEELGKQWKHMVGMAAQQHEYIYWY